MIFFVSTALYSVVFITSVVSTGAPLRVHIVDAIGLLIAFWLPAQFVGSPVTLRTRWLPVIGCILLGTFTWDVLSSLVIVKRPLFWEAALLYPAAVFSFSVLLLLHGVIIVMVRPRPNQAMQRTAR